MKHIVCSGLVTGLLLIAPSASYAQTAAQTAEPLGVFVNVNLGGQTQQRSLSTELTFPIYEQTGSLAAAQNIGRGGIFDLSGGYKVWSDLSIAVGFTTYSKTGDIVGAASVPHPLFLDRHVTTEINAESKRTERSIYFQGVWSIPLSRFSPGLDKFDLALSAGPSFISVQQDVLVGVNVPAGTQEANPDIQRIKDSAVGVILGADLNYMIAHNVGAVRDIGVGGFVRYQGAGAVDLAPAEETATGGFQIGVGLRLRF